MELGGEYTRETKKKWAETFRDMKKWESYSIASEEMMKYVDNKENKALKGCKQKHPCILSHQCQRIIIIRYQLV